MQRYTYHTHTHFSDGSSSPESYIKKAIELELNAIGFSDHAPIPFHPQKWNMPMEKLEEYFDHLFYLQSKYNNQIRVLSGLEVDYIPDLVNPKSEFITKNSIDYTIGSIHYLGFLRKGQLFGFELLGEKLQIGLNEVFKGNVMKMVEAYYKNIREMVTYFPPDIVGHLDRIKIVNSQNLLFSETDNWYMDEIKETLRVISDSKCILEVNTKTKDEDPNPSFWILRLAKDLNIPIVITSDAHTPNNLIYRFDEIERKLNQIGYTDFHVF